MSTLKIYNNFIEASGENILFGGAKSEVNPTDIEIRHNHLFKPLLWKEGEPGYTPVAFGKPAIVKNHFELKSGIRVLFEANLLENSWGGFTDTGFSILLTPKNQNNKCPKCAVTDVTIRYNRIRNVAGVIQVANGFSSDCEAPGGGRYSIHDLLVDSVHDEAWKGQGTFAFVNSNGLLLHDVAFDHVNGICDLPTLLHGEWTEEKIPNFSVTNSLFMNGGRRFGLSSTGAVAANCAHDSNGRWRAEAVAHRVLHQLQVRKEPHHRPKWGWPKGTIVVSSPRRRACAICKME